MFKFLHLGDIHLGYRQYRLIEREIDFFKAFDSVCISAIEENIDFVLITGDFFDQRSISPDVYNQAVFVLKKFKEKNIPVIAIEGNHDFKEVHRMLNIRGSWYQALANNELLQFLYLEENEEGFIFKANRSYIDLKIREHNIRIIGSRWYSVGASDKLKQLSKELEQLETPEDFFRIFMFHGGHECCLSLDRGGIADSDFQIFNEKVDYIALGHIHKFYKIVNFNNKDFIFNAGSLEASNISEIRKQEMPDSRGGLLVEVDKNKEIQTRLLIDYEQREFKIFSGISTKDFSDCTEMFNSIKEKVENYFNLKETKAIIFIEIENHNNFNISTEHLNELIQEIKKMGALHVLFKTNNIENNSSKILNNEEKNKDHLLIEEGVLKEIIEIDPSVQDQDKNKLLSSMLNLKEIINKDIETQEILNYI